MFRPDEVQESLQDQGIQEGGDSQRSEKGPDVSQRYAVGLSLDPGTGLPRVTSLGRGRTAEKMAQLARQSGVPVEEDPELVEKMFKPGNNRAIPARTYRLIAGILTFIYQVNEARTNRQAEEALEAMKGNAGDDSGEEIPENDANEEIEQDGSENA